MYLGPSETVRTYRKCLKRGISSAGVPAAVSSSVSSRSMHSRKLSRPMSPKSHNPNLVTCRAGRKPRSAVRAIPHFDSSGLSTLNPRSSRLLSPAGKISTAPPIGPIWSGRRDCRTRTYFESIQKMQIDATETRTEERQCVTLQSTSLLARRCRHKYWAMVKRIAATRLVTIDIAIVNSGSLLSGVFRFARLCPNTRPHHPFWIVLWK